MNGGGHLVCHQCFARVDNGEHAIACFKQGFNVFQADVADRLTTARKVATDATVQLLLTAENVLRLTDALKELLQEHQKADPHHEDICPTCKAAEAALRGGK